MFMHKVILLSLALSLVSGFSTLPSFGQATTAAVLGTVTDSSGAASPKATVTTVNLGTSETHTVETNDSGSYLFDNLIPSHYHITIKPRLSP
jgi:hypothetical protein